MANVLSEGEVVGYSLVDPVLEDEGGRFVC